MSWRPFSFGTISLLSLDGPVAEGSGLVHSTSPQRATGSDKNSYFVKGPEPEVVFAELAGCALANAVGLPVPAARACTIGNNVLAGTIKVSQLRAAIDIFIRGGQVLNYSSLYEAIVVDVWLANHDRNMGNVVASEAGKSRVELVYIDFEKSATLRERPFTGTAELAAADLWPSNELGDLLRERKPLGAPQAILDRVTAMTEAQCAAIIEPVANAVGNISWHQDSSTVLARRASRIQELVRETWR